MKLIIYLFIPLILMNCLNCHDSSKEKYYFLDKYESQDVGYPYGTIVYKSLQRNSYDTILIYSDIVKYAEDKSYIIVLQKPNMDLLFEEIKNNLFQFYKGYKKYNYTNENYSYPYGQNKDILLKNMDSIFLITKDSAKTYEIEANSIIKKELYYKRMFERKYNYYIINKKVDSIYGPLGYDKFKNLKNKNKINFDF